jgi:hypothetical protein
VRQRSISAESLFGYFVATNGEAILSTLKKQTTTKNVTGPPAAKSGYTPSKAALYSLGLPRFARNNDGIFDIVKSI